MTATPARRRGRGMYPKPKDSRHIPGDKRLARRTLPEYLTAGEVDALIHHAPISRGKLLILEQWRAGLRVSEALALTTADLNLEDDHPTLIVRSGKGHKSRVVPLHPELRAALVTMMEYGHGGKGRIIGVSRSTAWRWVKDAVARAVAAGDVAEGKKIGTHTLRHSYARHLLSNGVPINYLSRWLGHSSIQTTLVYLELVPDPIGVLDQVP